MSSRILHVLCTDFQELHLVQLALREHHVVIGLVLSRVACRDRRVELVCAVGAVRRVGRQGRRAAAAFAASVVV